MVIENYDNGKGIQMAAASWVEENTEKAQKFQKMVNYGSDGLQS